MPAPASDPLIIALLWQTYTLEKATSGAGQTFLLSVLTGVVTPLQNAGLKMVSAATASKSFSFLEGTRTSDLAYAVTEALRMWNSMTADDIFSLLTTRRISVTTASYGYLYQR